MTRAPITKLFFETKAVVDSLSGDRMPDVNESWQRLLDKRSAAVRARRRSLWRSVSRYAAAAVMAVAATSASFFFFGSEKLQKSPEYISGNGITSDMVILPDGTKVHVGVKTNIRLAPDYGKKQRVVYLEGEAYFDVARDERRPFIVKVNGQDIEALGTKFNVAAYSSDSLFTTTLFEGSIALSTDNIAERTIMKPDQQLVYDRSSHSVVVSDVDASLYTSWIDGYFYFYDQSLEHILSRVGDLYGMNFDVASETLGSKKFTGTFYRGQSVENILGIINMSIAIKYTITGSRISVESIDLAPDDKTQPNANKT